MTRRRPLPPLPDPWDPANDCWWAAYDRLDAIAADARAIADAARTARDRLRAGTTPDLEVLADRLRRWKWQADSLAIIAHPTLLARDAS
ncbi:MAG TPA: hypothetical protein VMM13_05680 [Euzebya sp.]|nr:hypothetical protein [Euzebya sp.]